MGSCEIFWAELAGGKRPVIVVSQELFNRGHYVTVVPLTTSKLAERAAMPNCVHFERGQFGLPKECVAQAEQIAVIETSRLWPSSIGRIDANAHRSLIQAIGFVLSATCEPL